MFKHIGPLVLVATTTNALWLATVDMTYSTNTGSGGIYGSPYCQVGKGDTEAQAWSQASSEGTDAVALNGIQHCNELSNKHTNQLGGFWDDYGTINYEDDNWHWYCNTGGGQGTCNAGNGAPKRK